MGLEGLRHQEKRCLSRGGADERRVISMTEKGGQESKTQGDTAETSGETEAELKKEGKKKEGREEERL